MRQNGFVFIKGFLYTLLLSGIRSDILIQSRIEVNEKKELPGHIIREKW